MHLPTLLSTLLLLAPALSLPIPTSLNCESPLSFTGSSDDSIINIRAFCNRRRRLTTPSKCSTSLFDLPSARSEQQAHAQQHQQQPSKRSTSLFDLPSAHSEQHARAQAQQDQPLTKRALASQTHNAQSPLPAPHLIRQPRLKHAPHPPRHHHHHHHHNGQIRSAKQALARLGEYTIADFRREAHGFLVALVGMSENLAIAGAVAVFLVVVLLAAVERWGGFGMRWARVEEEEEVYDVEEKVGLLEDEGAYYSDEKAAYYSDDKAAVVVDGEQNFMVLDPER